MEVYIITEICACSNFVLHIVFYNHPEISLVKFSHSLAIRYTFEQHNQCYNVKYSVTVILETLTNV